MLQTIKYHRLASAILFSIQGSSCISWSQSHTVEKYHPSFSIVLIFHLAQYSTALVDQVCAAYFSGSSLGCVILWVTFSVRPSYLLTMTLIFWASIFLVVIMELKISTLVWLLSRFFLKKKKKL
jgi:hypothetical protein